MPFDTTRFMTRWNGNGYFTKVKAIEPILTEDAADLFEVALRRKENRFSGGFWRGF